MISFIFLYFFNSYVGTFPNIVYFANNCLYIRNINTFLLKLTFDSIFLCFVSVVIYKNINNLHIVLDFSGKISLHSS